MNAWEDVIEEKLGQHGRRIFVGRVTGNGSRELLYYVDNQRERLAKGDPAKLRMRATESKLKAESLIREADDLEARAC